MGIELIVGAASLALGAISIAGNVASNASAAADRKASFDAQTAANNVQTAQQKNRSLYDRRARIREERVRRATMLQGSQNSGTAWSSSEIGALGSLTSNFNALGAQSAGESKANEGYNKLTQTAATFDENAKTTLAWNDVFQTGIKTTQNIFDL